MQHLHCFIGVVLISVFYCSAAENDASAALNQFSLNLLSKISEGLTGDRNIAIGPYTIWTALAIINEGASGNTERELSDALGIPYDRRSFIDSQKFNIKNLKQDFDGITLDIANDIFIRNQAQIHPTYNSTVQEIYNVAVESLDFGNPSGAAHYINSKIRKATHGYIQDIVSQDVISNSNIILTTAMFFKGLWVKKFERLPFKRQFKNGLGYTNDIDVMYAGDEYNVRNILNDQAQAVEIPYKGDRISMIVVLPKGESTVEKTLKSLTKQPFKNIVAELRNHPEVDITMPAFKISLDTELRDILKALKINDVFSNYADLRKLSPEQLSISTVRHRAEIEVNEAGTVAAAAAAIGVMPISIPSNIIVRVDRPFSFFIYDKKTESILFTGIVNDPTVI